MGYAEWRDLLHDEVTVALQTGVDGYGAPTYGAGAVVPAYVAARQVMVRAFTGDERVSRVQVYVLQHLGADAQTRVTLPARCVPREPALLAVEQLNDETGAIGEVLYA